MNERFIGPLILSKLGMPPDGPWIPSQEELDRLRADADEVLQQIRYESYWDAVERDR